MLVPGCGSTTTAPQGETGTIADTYASLMFLHEQYRLPDGEKDSIRYHHRMQSLLDSAGYSQQEFSAAVERQLANVESARRFYEHLHRALELRKNNHTVPAP